MFGTGRRENLSPFYIRGEKEILSPINNLFFSLVFGFCSTTNTVSLIFFKVTLNKFSRGNQRFSAKIL